MMRGRIEDLPLWLFAFLTVAGFNAIALGGLVCTRRLGQSLGLYAFIDNESVGAIFSAILVMYAISLGLIAVASCSDICRTITNSCRGAGFQIAEKFLSCVR